MDVINSFKRTWVWCRRFRNRRGYGVHSPFAFNLITWIIYEKQPFYAYKELNGIRKDLSNAGERLNPVRVDELLFRLVNNMYPKNILEIGTGSGLSTVYIARARKKASVTTFDLKTVKNAERLFTGYNIAYRTGEINRLVADYLDALRPVDFVHLNERKPLPGIYERLQSKVHCNSLFVIEGIHASRDMRDWWDGVVADERTGITFDLYDVGLVFYDKTKIKQHYIINF